MIFLDEPTTGLDPRSRRTMWEIIRELAADGVTILLTTQYLDEADQLADRIAVLDQGRIVAEGTPAELKGRIPGGHVRLHFADPDACCTRPPGCSRRPLADQDQLVLQVPATAPWTRCASCSTSSHEARIDVERLSIHTPDLDDVFLAVTGSHVTGASSTRPDTARSSATMTTLAYTVSDSRVMLRRNLKHQLRYPSMTLMLVGMPIVFLLLFVYVFGGQLGAGLGAHEGRGAYLDYVVPGLLLVTVASAVQGTSIMVAMDMTGGIIDRFRTMAIARASVLTGHVLGSLIQTLAALGRPDRRRLRPRVPHRGRAARLAGRHRDTGPVRLRADLAGRRTRSGRQERRDRQQHPDGPVPAACSSAAGSCRTATMPDGLRQFAEYQPFTPVADTVRGLLTGAAVGDHAIAAIAWSIGIAVVAYLWAIRLYNRRRAAEPK